MSHVADIVRAADLSWVPWKNGAGVLADIVVSPPGAGWDDFDWRVSTAIVERDTPFSHFPACDRGMVLLSGTTLMLDVAGTQPALCVAPPPMGQPVVFAGDVPVTGRPLGGPITNLNIMARRDRYAFCMLEMNLTSDLAVTPPVDGQTIFVVRSGHVRLDDGRLAQARDAVVSRGPYLLSTDIPTSLVAITVWPRPPHAPL